MNEQYADFLRIQKQQQMVWNSELQSEGFCGLSADVTDTNHMPTFPSLTWLKDTLGQQK